ncbi:MAG: hypothetical protein HY664_04885 [Chloroflexi bacterium]|nr:hypothetical protein [Chloroflexota bacterium]
MRDKVDQLRQHCESLLEPGEEIKLAAEATCKLGLLTQLGLGRAFLTDRRMLFLRRRMPFGIDRLFFWIPDMVTITLSEIDDVRMVEGLNKAFLVIRVGAQSYALRLGTSSFMMLMLRHNPETTRYWLDTIQNARGGLPRPFTKTTTTIERRTGRIAGIVIIALTLALLPLWVISLSLSEMSTKDLVVVAIPTVSGLTIGLLLVWASRGNK